MVDGLFARNIHSSGNWEMMKARFGFTSDGVRLIKRTSQADFGFTSEVKSGPMVFLKQFIDPKMQYISDLDRVSDGRLSRLRYFKPLFSEATSNSRADF